MDPKENTIDENPEVVADAAAPDVEVVNEAVDPTIEWKNRVAYLSAEIENMRKRFMREKSDVVRFANEGLLKALLPVMDNLQLAVQASGQTDTKGEQDSSGQLQAMLKGLQITIKHFEQNLEMVGVQVIPSVGQAFDPAVHEAMGQGSDPQQPADHVIGEIQRGYSLHGRVLRPAKVIVNTVQN